MYRDKQENGTGCVIAKAKFWRQLDLTVWNGWDFIESVLGPECRSAEQFDVGHRTLKALFNYQTDEETFGAHRPIGPTTEPIA